MLLRIHVSQARLGMFVECFEGAWHDNPFWRPRLRLSDTAELAKLKRSAIQTLRIDLSKGVGPLPARREAPSPAHPPPPAARPKGAGFASRRSDILAATATLKRTTQALGSLYETVRRGGEVDLSLAREVVDDIEATMRTRPLALLEITRLKTKDEYTYRHSVAVCALVVHFARHLGLETERARLLGLAAMLHDIGKLAMPSALLGKPGQLSEDELAIVRTHPQEGYRLLSNGDLPELVRDICLHHHERIDGEGYPDGLKGDQIGLELRIVSICDVFDALTSTRPYKTAWSPRVAFEQMARWSGQFDAALLPRFADSLRLALDMARAPLARTRP